MNDASGAFPRAGLASPRGDLLPPRSLAAAASAGRLLLDALGGGARIGESTVASMRVHVLHPSDPDTITVLTDRDAGQFFYGRRQSSQIVHLDVFHAPGAMPPRAVAASFHAALEAYRRVLPGLGALLHADAFDVQTAAGGGCVGGALTGGRRVSVMAAHRGHVHLAGRLPRGDTAFCFFLVAALERALAAQGLQPRRPLRVVAALAGADLEVGDGLRQYEALTDSHLREPGDASEAGGRTAHRGAPGSEGKAPAGPGRIEPAPAQSEVPIPPDAWLAQAARLADDLGGVDAARGLLEALAAPCTMAALPVARSSPATARAALARLVQGGWAEGAGSLWRLTPQGEALRRVFTRHLREVELALRAAARAVIPGAGRLRLPGGGGGQAGRSAARAVAAPRPGERWGEVAGPETVLAAARRTGTDRMRSWGGAVAGALRVLQEDLRVRTRVRPRRVDLCLLLDASASMEGGRMRAARTLARHLVLTGRGRVAVMTFQERHCVLAVPLTRNYAAAERGLRRIAPSGLTPLAAGLRAARRYLGGARAKNPLLLLVTDGIPTAAMGEGSPLDEALIEAARLRDARVALCCIGLEPNERYLSELVRRAGGRLHVLTELRPEALARLAHDERARLEATGGRSVRRARPTDRPAAPSVPPARGDVAPTPDLSGGAAAP